MTGHFPRPGLACPENQSHRINRQGSIKGALADPYRRGVTWWKIKNRPYSQADDGRGELLNGDMRTLARLRKGRPNLRGLYSA